VTSSEALRHVGRALRAAPAAHAAVIGAEVAALVAMTTAMALLFALDDGQDLTSSERQRLRLLFVPGFLVLSFAWGVATAVQRAAAVAIASRERLALQVLATLRRSLVDVLRLGALFGVTATTLGVAVGLAIATARVPSGWEGALTTLVCLGLWIGSRGLVGTVTARIVCEGEGWLAALRAGVRQLEGRRWASIASRAPLVGIAATATIAAHDWHYGFVLLVAGEPLAITADGVIEAAWHAELERVSAEPIARVFE
jgi:hypothetical protein